MPNSLPFPPPWPNFLTFLKLSKLPSFSDLPSLSGLASLPPPPAWLLEESQRRLVLLMNHVLQQEPHAMQRLVRQSGRVIVVQWRDWSLRLQVTPAGLFDLAAAEQTGDLILELNEPSPWRLAQTLLHGEKPPVRVEGDVQLAAEVNWLADNVRWDIEEDLARIVGDVPAYALVLVAGTALAAVRSFLLAPLRSGGTAA